MNVLSVLRLFAGSIVVSITVGGCATSQPIPELSQPQSSGLGIDVTLKAPIGLFRSTPDQVYFVKIDGEDSPRQQQIIRSNYSKGGRVYLLNARPGTYVAVGAFLLRSQATGGPGTRFTTYFSKELVEQTKVIVRENDFVFMGTYVVDQLVGLDRAEGVETDYTTLFLLAATGDVRYRGVLLERKTDEQARTEFFRNAKEDLAGSGWAARLK